MSSIWITTFVTICALAIALGMGPAFLASRTVLRPVMARNEMRRWQAPVACGFQIGAVGTAILIFATLGPRAGALAGVLALLALLALMDWKWRWLPIEWTSGVIVIGLTLALVEGHFLESAVTAMATAAALFSLMIVFRALRGIDGMGQGDIWLAAGLATISGPLGIAQILGLAAVTGIFQEIAEKMMQNQDVRQRFGVAFGTHLCLVFTLLLLFGVI
jgi:leader peptidase (prepilin peptidase)/N-methyltransferase